MTIPRVFHRSDSCCRRLHRWLAMGCFSLSLVEVASARPWVQDAQAPAIPRAPIVMQDRPLRPVRPNLEAVTDQLDLEAIRTATVTADVRVLVARLGDPEWSVREDAARRLEVHPSPNEALLRVLDQDELDEEQRQRLMNVIALRIVFQPRGALGIRMNTRMGFADGGIAGVEITQLIAGLPAERVLRVGDVITRIDDREIRVNTDLITHVQRMQPGQIIDVRVLRPRTLPAGEAPGAEWIHLDGDRWFEPVEVEFALGSYEKLGDTVGVVNPETQRRLEEVRQLRIQWDHPAVSLDGRVTVDGVVPPEKSQWTPPTGRIRRIDP
jgi:hypothetical protein